MSGDVKRLLAGVPTSVARKVKVALAEREETMQDAIVKSLVSYLGVELTQEELEQLNLLTKMEDDERALSEVVNT